MQDLLRIITRSDTGKGEDDAVLEADEDTDADDNDDEEDDEEESEEEDSESEEEAAEAADQATERPEGMDLEVPVASTSGQARNVNRADL